LFHLLHVVLVTPAKVDDLQTSRGLLHVVVVVPLNVEVVQVCGENFPAAAQAGSRAKTRMANASFMFPPDVDVVLL
jgi:hypothetical protein